MTRRPGYDIYGAPTKVDPRDYPDPLDVTEPDLSAAIDDTDANLEYGGALYRFRDQPRPRRFAGCVTLALVAFWLAAALIVRANLATPRNAPVQPAQSGAPQGLGTVATAADHAPLVVRNRPDDGPMYGLTGGAPQLSETEKPAPTTVSEFPATPLATVTWSGIVNYAAPSLGRFYLAIPAGKGVRVRICGPAGCLDRTSTDAGPDLAQQRAGRIADLNSVDWQTISGVPLRFGGFQGTVLVLKRTPHPLPATDVEPVPPE